MAARSFANTEIRILLAIACDDGPERIITYAAAPSQMIEGNHGRQGGRIAVNRSFYFLSGRLKQLAVAAAG
ncbi:hypothetical protein BCCGELA001_29960 [Bradyrhizobium sp. CCGE-LA001]|nr:hypothetical protein BCCGELA001_29960 [Bradyrhizobium sp. CCGE-LA001]